ncbi:hypothetical protein [Sulfurisphaera ohwakuensis]|uniref:Uncharacterized protein n=1 Tax=Sulfurisphaera ohwakuensis TaxID=69656 RepID=A0A7J9RUH7_SULOH|nr:hypothetical protein [Sulfurisphaera ohwakuensis]MBB5254613.1 hypothetical protein [Sulfurisphaera ohwakuensis]
MEQGNRGVYKEEVMRKLHEIISSLHETKPIDVELVREDRDNN